MNRIIFLSILFVACAAYIVFGCGTGDSSGTRGADCRKRDFHGGCDFKIRDPWKEKSLSPVYLRSGKDECAAYVIKLEKSSVGGGVLSTRASCLVDYDKKGDAFHLRPLDKMIVYETLPSDVGRISYRTHRVFRGLLNPMYKVRTGENDFALLHLKNNEFIEFNNMLGIKAAVVEPKYETFVDDWAPIPLQWHRAKWVDKVLKGQEVTADEVHPTP